MSTATAYSVLSLGFEAGEQRLLRTLFALSQQGTRHWRYEDAESQAAATQGTLVLVNADDDDAMTHYWISFANRKDVIVVLAAREQTAQLPSHLFIRRPLRASSLLAALDQAVADRRSAQAARQTQAQRGTPVRRTLYRQLTAMTFGHAFHKA